MTGIILAGGQNKRMGKDKALIEIGGKRVIEWVYKTLEQVCNEIIVVANMPLKFLHLPVRIVTDIIPYQGPLGGIFTGLFYTTEFPAVVLACDLPFVSASFLNFLFSQWEDKLDALIPQTPDGHQPLCALYGKDSLPVFESQLKRGDLRLYQALRKVRKRYLSPELVSSADPSGLNFFNLNTPQDLARAQKLWQKTHSQRA